MMQPFYARAFLNPSAVLASPLGIPQVSAWRLKNWTGLTPWPAWNCAAGIIQRAYSAELPGLRAGSRAVRCAPLRAAAISITCRRAATGSLPAWSIADVAGHGEASARPRFACMTRLRQHVDHWDQSALIRDLNETFPEGSRTSQFATAFLASFYSDSGELLFTNAGHLPPLWYRAATKEWSLLHDSTPLSKEIVRSAAGIDRGNRVYSQTAVQLEPGDLLLLYTDGISEAYDESGRQLGLERLLSDRQESARRSAIAAGKELLAAVARFRGSAPPTDDETVVALQRRADGTHDARLQVKFAMPSDPRYLPVVRGAIGPVAEAIGWDESRVPGDHAGARRSPRECHPARLSQSRRRAD